MNNRMADSINGLVNICSTDFLNSNPARTAGMVASTINQPRRAFASSKGIAQDQAVHNRLEDGPQGLSRKKRSAAMVVPSSINTL